MASDRGGVQRQQPHKRQPPHVGQPSHLFFLRHFPKNLAEDFPWHCSQTPDWQPPPAAAAALQSGQPAALVPNVAQPLAVAASAAISPNKIPWSTRRSILFSDCERSECFCDAS
jgi:hypothetical protein